MKKTLLATSILAATLLAPITASANIRINGFANFVAGATTNDDESFNNYTGDIDYSNDSLFALQVSSDINSRMTATAQILARGNNDYNAELEWAYITYAGDNDMTYTAGRFRMPLFAYSASLDVGYSYHWLTAPQLVYDVPYRNMDGLKINKAFSGLGFDYNLALSHGNVSGEALGTDLTVDQTTLLSLEATNFEWTARAVYGFGDVTLDLNNTDPLLQQLSDFNQAVNAYGFAELGSNILVEDDQGTFVGASLFYDNSKFFAGAEFTVTDLENSFTSKDTAYYLTGGFRFGKWTTALTYENFESEGDVNYLEDINELAAIDDFSQQLALFAAGVQAGQISETESITATVRYEAARSTAITLESNHVNDKLTDDTATLVRLGVSYVF